MRKTTYEDYVDRVREAVVFVHDNLDSHHTVADLAQRCFLSRYHFQRVFQRIVGETCQGLCRRLRLERAAWQLQNTEQSVSSIAIDAGYTSIEAFARAFRAVFGSTATEFRDRHWDEYRILSPNRAHYTPNGAPLFEPLARDLCPVPFEVREVEEITVYARRHEGSPHLIGKSLRIFWEDLTSGRPAETIGPVIAFADNLGPNSKVEEIDSFVSSGVPMDGLIERKIGGGRHIVVEYKGEGEALGDFWFRLWAEVLPASRCALRPAPCFQLLRFPGTTETLSQAQVTIYVPVEGD